MEDTGANPVEGGTPETDWKAKYEEIAPKADKYDKLEPQYKGLQRELNKARTEHVSKADIAALEDRIAAALDAMSQSEDDDIPKRKPRPSEVVKAARPQETRPDIPPDISADAKRALRLMDRLNLSEAEKERMKNDYEPSDAVDKLEKDLETKITKDATEAALQNFRQAQKATGATKGDGLPSASGSRSFTRSQIGEMSYAEYKANEKDIDAATREGRIS
uniref:Uncharacterized protein n=1 Tax=viral metagenome TaxID=1070528 RepID=A0A6M3JYP9_9ZZZZ